MDMTGMTRSPSGAINTINSDIKDFHTNIPVPLYSYGFDRDVNHHQYCECISVISHLFLLFLYPELIAIKATSQSHIPSIMEILW